MARQYGQRYRATNPVVIALDPGGVSGWSVLAVAAPALEAVVDGGVTILDNISHWAHGQTVGGEDEQAAALIELIEVWPGAAIVIEDFLLRKHTMSRELLSPVRITAKVGYGLWLAHRRFFLQQPVMAMTAATDTRLKDWGLYESEGGMQHARDADRHAITFLRRAKDKEALRKMAWPKLYG